MTRFGLIADAHIAPDEAEACVWHGPFALDEAAVRLRAARNLLDMHTVDVVLMLGDLTHLGDEESMRIGIAELEVSRAPVWVVPGDHDVLRRADLVARLLRRRTHVKIAPQATRLPGTHIVLAGIQTASGGTRSTGRLAVDSWGDSLAVVMTHRPILDRREALEQLGVQYAGGLLDDPTLTQALMERQAPTIVVSGHLHVRDCHNAGNVLQVISPALVEDPAEVALIDVAALGCPAVSVTFYPLTNGAREWPTLVNRRTSWEWGDRDGWERRNSLDGGPPPWSVQSEDCEPAEFQDD